MAEMTKAATPSVDTLGSHQLFTWEAVAAHSTPKSMWVSIRNKVYDITEFATSHPGGHEVIRMAAGRDITQLFESYHDDSVSLVLAKYYIGDLASSELPSFPEPSKFSKDVRKRVKAHFDKTGEDPATPSMQMWGRYGIVILAFLAGMVGTYTWNIQQTFGTRAAWAIWLGFFKAQWLPRYEGQEMWAPLMYCFWSTMKRPDEIIEMYFSKKIMNIRVNELTLGDHVVFWGGKINQYYHPVLSDIVSSTCEEFGIKFNYIPTTYGAILLHLDHLRVMGKKTSANSTQSTYRSTQSTQWSTESLHHESLYDVVIVGGGVAGTALAAALSSKPSLAKSRVALIESADLYVKPESAHGRYSNRVSSFNPSSVDFFKTLGIWSHLESHSRTRAFTKMEVWDAIGNGRVSFSTPETPIAHIIENNAVQAALVAMIDREGGNGGATVEVFNRERVKDIKRWETPKVLGGAERNEGVEQGQVDFLDQIEWPEVVLESGKRIKARLLIGADGAPSRVRSFAGVDFFGWDYDQRGLVATLKVDERDENVTAWQRFLPTGPVSLLPLAPGYSSMVWSTTPALASLLPKLPASVFTTLANAAFHNTVPDLEFLTSQAQREFGSPTATATPSSTTDYAMEAEWGRSIVRPVVNIGTYPTPPEILDVQEGSRAPFPLRLRHAGRYVTDRVALVGDAAHLVHPLAGLGLNMGLGDVQALADVLGEAAANGADLGSIHVVQTYASSRYLPNLVMLGVLDKFKWLFSNDVAPLAWLRSAGMDAFNAIEPVKLMAMRFASGKGLF
ncbi:putative ubiquinone biosynthesis monooxygenase [Gonapodya sp. JEL0774]|nr:putative ubiquinone biosynthesis monooxygenase [Gonapodya sp. JEL0774]